MINIKKACQDARGKIFVMFEDGKEFAHIITLKAGASRGGHFHDKDEVIRVLDGELDFAFLDPSGEGEEKRGTIARGDEILIEAGMAHILTAKEDSLLLGMLQNCKTEKYEPYDIIVESFVKNK